MAFIRTGECNLCGECCGFPRSTDGGQNNPWPNDIPDIIRTWSDESIQQDYPVLYFIGYTKDKNKKYGIKKVGVNTFHWIFVPGHGLCADKSPYGNLDKFDQRCPFLSEKLPDGTVPCLLYNTSKKYIWNKLCQPVPPDEFTAQEEVDRWYKRCPSCSYIYKEE